MPDLWKALGDVYGDADADAPPVAVEPAATQRAGAALGLDDDLAAALSAALVNAPSAPSTADPVAPPPAPPAQERVATWISEIETRQELREKGPDLDAALPEGPTWTRVNDDILPSGKSKGRKGRRR